MLSCSYLRTKFSVVAFAADNSSARARVFYRGVCEMASVASLERVVHCITEAVHLHLWRRTPRRGGVKMSGVYGGIELDSNNGV